jgi:hypothetical protein
LISCLLETFVLLTSSSQNLGTSRGTTDTDLFLALSLSLSLSPSRLLFGSRFPDMHGDNELNAPSHLRQLIFTRHPPNFTLANPIPALQYILLCSYAVWTLFLFVLLAHFQNLPCSFFVSPWDSSHFIQLYRLPVMQNRPGFIPFLST